MTERLPDGRFGVIYADPPWHFTTRSPKGQGRSASRHYKTMTLREIMDMPVSGISADDCALFMWAIDPMLPHALQVIEAWGFQYKTVAFTWVKENRASDGYFTGMGYWTRANPEMCLLATRGRPRRLARDVRQLVMAPRGRHSEKPEEVARRIERLVPGPYCELFARRKRDGWTVWGNEI